MKVPAMVWSEGPADDHVRWSERVSLPDLVFSWPSAGVLDDRRTGSTPSIAGMGSQTCMAWRGGGADEQIYWSRLHGSSMSAGGAVWSPQQAVGFRTPTFPTLATLGGRTFMFFKGNAGYGGAMRWTELRSDQWTSPVEVCPTGIAGCGIFQTDDGYSATENVHDDSIYAAWRLKDNDAYTWGSQIAWGSLDNDEWTGPSTTGFFTDRVPAIASDGTNVYMAWRTQSGHIAWSVLLGSQWRAPQTLDDRLTVGGPAIGVSEQGRLVMVWVGVNGPEIFWSSFENSRWGEQRMFTDRRAFFDPARQTDIRVSLA